MLYVDTPTPQDIARLNAARGDVCISIYVPTTPLTQRIGESRLKFRHLISEAADQARAAGHAKREVGLAEIALLHLAEDDHFWRVQANSLAVFATPSGVTSFRLANKLAPSTEVADRFHLLPLMRAVTFPHEAFVLALSEKGVRLVQVFSDMPAKKVKVPGLPKDAASHAGKTTINDKSSFTRIHGEEGQRIRHLSYLRAIDAALRPILAGRDTPLIVAAVDPLAHLYPHVNTYHRMAHDQIRVSPDAVKDNELARLSVPVLDGVYAEDLFKAAQVFEQHSSNGRTATDLTDVARAATYGAVDTLFADMNDTRPGLIDDKGHVTFAKVDTADNYRLVDEVARRVIVNGGKVFAVRAGEVPGGRSVGAILRYPV
ncbi:hypothetical protein BBF93_06105 [Hyphomonas sp. CACIAM 19H1]|uniref:baeRF11 domain-containing protein n=1 Tax=Hyphomonas sp. CACIAM 19H1 TaxID=1873716 RepID=UPI000DED592E|nr:hypothetical protein [Hyphomonas sp. CACIAM 19H1]AXE63838.1 hypothetical protein BBF93_06105 [Hyphomonas sp. CACIAM 19H1]